MFFVAFGSSCLNCHVCFSCFSFRCCLHGGSRFSAQAIHWRFAQLPQWWSGSYGYNPLGESWLYCSAFSPLRFHISKAALIWAIDQTWLLSWLCCSWLTVQGEFAFSNANFEGFSQTTLKFLLTSVIGLVLLMRSFKIRLR